MFGQRPCDCDVIVCLTCIIDTPYLSFCLWRRWRRGLCCPDWPRPVCDARLWLALWLEACLWRRQGRGSVFCPGSSVVSRGVGVRLQTRVRAGCGFGLAQIVTPSGFTTHLSFPPRPPPAGGAVSAGTGPAFSPPAAAGRPSPWWATWIWVCCATPSPRFCSCSNDNRSR